jgi:peroxiredoxin
MTRQTHFAHRSLVISWLSWGLATLCALPSPAGQFNPTRSIGDQIQGWSQLPGTDDRLHSMEDLKAHDVIVVVFTCNSCPYAVDYEDRINTLAKKFADAKINAAVVAINSNKVEADLLPAMKQRAESKGFRFDYLFDESQEVAKQFGAVRTPEFFVLNKERKIAYMGAMDDSTKPESVTQRYVEAAVDAVLAGRSVAVTETAPIGCLIRFERRKK